MTSAMTMGFTVGGSDMTMAMLAGDSDTTCATLPAFIDIGGCPCASTPIVIDSAGNGDFVNAIVNLEDPTNGAIDHLGTRGGYIVWSAQPTSERFGFPANQAQHWFAAYYSDVDNLWHLGADGQPVDLLAADHAVVHYTTSGFSSISSVSLIDGALNVFGLDAGVDAASSSVLFNGNSSLGMTGNRPGAIDMSGSAFAVRATGGRTNAPSVEIRLTRDILNGAPVSDVWDTVNAQWVADVGQYFPGIVADGFWSFPSTPTLSSSHDGLNAGLPEIQGYALAVRAPDVTTGAGFVMASCIVDTEWPSLVDSFGAGDFMVDDTGRVAPQYVFTDGSGVASATVTLARWPSIYETRLDAESAGAVIEYASGANVAGRVWSTTQTAFTTDDFAVGSSVVSVSAELGDEPAFTYEFSVVEISDFCGNTASSQSVPPILTRTLSDPQLNPGIGFDVSCLEDGLPVELFSNATMVEIGATVEILNSGQSADGNGAITFVSTGTNVGVVTETTEVVFAQTGPYESSTFDVRVTNPDGGTNTETVTVFCNRPPFCVGSNIIDGFTYEGTVEFLVTGTVDDLEGIDDIVSVEVSIDGGDFEEASLDNGVYEFTFPTEFATSYEINIRATDSVGNVTQCANFPRTITIASPCGADIDIAGIQDNFFVTWTPLGGNQWEPELQISGFTDAIVPASAEVYTGGNVFNVPGSFAGQLPEAEWSAIGADGNPVNLPPTESRSNFGDPDTIRYHLPLPSNPSSNTLVIDVELEVISVFFAVWNRATNERYNVRVIDDGGLSASLLNIVSDDSGRSEPTDFDYLQVSDPLHLSRQIRMEADIPFGTDWSELFLVAFRFGGFAVPERIFTVSAFGASIDPVARRSQASGLVCTPSGAYVEPHVQPPIDDTRFTPRISDRQPNVPIVESLRVNNPDCYDRTVILMIAEAVDNTRATGNGDHTVTAQVAGQAVEVVAQARVPRVEFVGTGVPVEGGIASVVNGVALFSAPAFSSIDIEVTSVLFAPGTYGRSSLVIRWALT